MVEGNLTVNPGTRSANSWTTNGVALVQTAGTWTDLTSSGTVANTYINLFSTQTVATTTATTYTNLYGTYFQAPAAGTNVTATNRYALGADSIYSGGKITATGSTANAPLNIGAVSAVPTTPVNGDIWYNASGIINTYFNGGLRVLATLAGGNTWTSANIFSGPNNSFGTYTTSTTDTLSSGATTSGNTKTVNIGTGGLSGSTTIITVGTTSSGSTSSITLLGTLFATPRADATTSATTWGVFYNPVTREITTATSGAGAASFNGGTVTSATTFSSTVTISSTESSVSTTTGALQVSGGVGIRGSLNVGGSLNVNGQAVLPTSIQEFTATQGQTTFTITGGYTVGTTLVYANGILLGSGDYTAANGTTIVLNNARNAGDVIRVVAALATNGINQMQAFSVAMSIALG